MNSFKQQTFKLQCCGREARLVNLESQASKEELEGCAELLEEPLCVCESSATCQQLHEDPPARALLCSCWRNTWFTISESTHSYIQIWVG